MRNFDYLRCFNSKINLAYQLDEEHSAYVIDIRVIFKIVIISKTII